MDHSPLVNFYELKLRQQKHQFTLVHDEKLAEIKNLKAEIERLKAQIMKLKYGPAAKNGQVAAQAATAASVVYTTQQHGPSDGCRRLWSAMDLEYRAFEHEYPVQQHRSGFTGQDVWAAMDAWYRTTGGGPGVVGQRKHNWGGKY